MDLLNKTDVEDTDSWEIRVFKFTSGTLIAARTPKNNLLRWSLPAVFTPVMRPDGNVATNISPFADFISSPVIDVSEACFNNTVLFNGPASSNFEKMYIEFEKQYKLMKSGIITSTSQIIK